MRKQDEVYNKLSSFIEKYDITCVEDVYQQDSVNEECVDLVAELVEIMLK